MRSVGYIILFSFFAVMLSGCNAPDIKVKTFNNGEFSFQYIDNTLIGVSDTTKPPMGVGGFETTEFTKNGIKFYAVEEEYNAHRKQGKDYIFFDGGVISLKDISPHTNTSYAIDNLGYLELVASTVQFIVPPLSELGNTYSFEGEDQVTTRVYKNKWKSYTEELLAQKALFDSCPGLYAYEKKPFYKKMITTLEKTNPPAYSETRGEEDQKILDVCYSEKLGIVLLLTNTSYEIGGASFGVYEYNVIAEEIISSSIHRDTIPYPTEFGSRTGKMIRLMATLCPADGSDGMIPCQKPYMVFYYDLEFNKLVGIAFAGG